MHHNVETASSYYDEVSTTVRYEGRLRTIRAVREAGLETCVGGILNLGESRAQRVEMAFELAAIDPTSVPINLLNPRPGTKFGDRELMDPWEAVKWIAIFRLILPEALFRVCGGRVENLGELQPLAVKAGLNGVMMGNFLTTLGAEPEQDRAMFAELGLNVARQPDNGANPRPDNRSGWLDGETPGRRGGAPRRGAARRADRPEGAAVGPLDPAALPRQAPGGPRSRPEGARQTLLGEYRHERDRGAAGGDRAAGASRRLRLISGPQGPRVLLDGRPVLLLCSNNYLGLADHPHVREAAAEAAMRWGVGAGASRLVSGTMTIHRRLEERLAAFKGSRGVRAVRLGLPRQPRRDRRARRAPATRSSPTSSTTPRSSTAAAPRARAVHVYRHLDAEHLALEPAPPRRRRAAADRHRLGLLDGRRRGAAAGDRRARPPPPRARAGRRGARYRRARPGRARRGRRRPAWRARWTCSSARSARRSAPTARTCAPARRWCATCQHRAPADLLHRPCPPGGGGRAGRARADRAAPPPRAAAALARPHPARGARRRGLRRAGGRRCTSCRCSSARSATQLALCQGALERGVFAQAIRPPSVPAGSARLRLTAMASHTPAELRRAARALRERRARLGLEPALHRGGRRGGRGRRRRSRRSRRPPRARRERPSTSSAKALTRAA